MRGETPAAAIAAPTAAPDWSTLPELLPCPRCDYNVRTLTQPRCPECGANFDWPSVIAAAHARVDSRLFEHQWRRRPIGSFLETAWLLLRPRRFWRDPSLKAAPRVGPLLMQFVSTCLALALVAALIDDLHLWRALRHDARRPAWKYPFGPMYLEYFRETFFYNCVMALRFAGFLAVNFMFFLALRRTRNRFGIRGALVLRLFAYSGLTAACHATGLYLGLTSLREFAPRWTTWIRDVGVMNVTWYASVVMLVVVVDLGLRRHMGLRCGWAIMLLVYVVLYGVVTALTALAAVWYDSFENPMMTFFRDYLGFDPGHPLNRRDDPIVAVS